MPDRPVAIETRLAQPADAVAIAALSHQLGYPSTTADTRARLIDVIGTADHTVSVALVDNAVVGWIHVGIKRCIESDSFAEILGLVVEQQYRGRGIGATLVAQAECWAAGREQTRVRVRSNLIRHEAHGFYVKLGYAETKRQAVLDKQFTPVSRSVL